MGLENALIGMTGSAGLGLADSILKNRYARDAESRATQRAMITEHANRTYNDPAAQVARLRAAGLSPGLVYGNMNLSGSSGLEGIQPAERYSGLEHGSGTAIQAADLASSMKQREAQILKTEADTAETIVNTAIKTEDEDFIKQHGVSRRSPVGVTIRTLKEVDDSINKAVPKVGDWIKDKWRNFKKKGGD